MREHVVQSNPVSEGSKAFDPNIFLTMQTQIIPSRVTVHALRKQQPSKFLPAWTVLSQNVTIQSLHSYEQKSIPDQPR